MNLLPTYDKYMEYNLAPIRKSLEKRLNGNGSSVDSKIFLVISFVKNLFVQFRSSIDTYQTVSSNTFSSSSKFH